MGDLLASPTEGWMEIGDFNFLRSILNFVTSFFTDGGIVILLFAPAQRHPMIYQAFEDLNPGEVFILVNDHDPKPLYYHFKFERDGQFDWNYLEEGPQVWRVEVGKK